MPECKAYQSGGLRCPLEQDLGPLATHGSLPELHGIGVTIWGREQGSLVHNVSACLIIRTQVAIAGHAPTQKNIKNPLLGIYYVILYDFSRVAAAVHARTTERTAT